MVWRQAFSFREANNRNSFLAFFLVVCATNLLAKLEVADRTQAALKGRDLGLI